MQQNRVKFVHYTPHFLRSFQKLPAGIQALARLKDELFCGDSFDPRLHTHKLKGELSGFWSYSVNYAYRVLFRFLRDEEVIYYDIGTHEIYR
ncbi:MAG: type II toxin-antitoxin system mRNA interferase toxin, RelE/StbE family [Candidatus Omnitrophota bacterium]